MNSTQSDMDLFRPSLSFNTEQPEITKAFTNSINSNSQSTYFISYGWLNVSHCFLANGWCPWKACHSQDCWNFWDLVSWSILSIVLNSAYLANYFQDFTTQCFIAFMRSTPTKNGKEEWLFIMNSIDLKDIQFYSTKVLK